MSQRKIGKSWWVDITHDGVRYRKKSPDNSKPGAQAYEATLRKKLAEGAQLEETEKNNKRAQPFKTFVWFWFQTHVLVHNKPSMIAKTRGILNKKLVPHFGNVPLNEITTLQVERYKAKRAGEGLSNKTINGELGVLGKCLRDARRWLDVEQIPDIRMLKVPPADYDFLSEEECGRVLTELSGVWYDIAYLALKTGLRLAELQALQWQDVALERSSILVKHSQCSITRELLSPKGNKTRTIPLTNDVVELLKKRQQSSGYVFPVNGGTFRQQRLNQELAEACARSGIRKVTCHVLRHSYASQLALKGVPILVIQKLLGHTDIKVTMRYAHLSEESLKNAALAISKPFSTPSSESSAKLIEHDASQLP